jgi:D-glycero-D-manno-heptose 1,7-bisphosphate phosphatase
MNGTSNLTPETSNLSRAVFLDKDGTLIENVPYNVDPEKIRLYPDAALALKRLQDEGYKLFVISNQSGIAYGYFEESALGNVWNEISGELATAGVKIDGYYYCPHHPEGKVDAYKQECECRKPSAGMLVKAAEEHNINLSRSWMIGDILNDVEAGNKAGCKTILINNGNETEWVMGDQRVPDYFAASLLESAIIIDNHSDEKKRIFSESSPLGQAELEMEVQTEVV